MFHRYHRLWIILVMVMERALGLSEHTPVPSTSKNKKLGSDLAIYLGKSFRHRNNVCGR
ncbi:hypothetical protein PHET_09131 [Paragonimus heterotremus]|uniref:Uncharacterized protein n=1 Tax=Paragonimus heterotremus TaxID=100268 RepID=A0A8J4WF07_9TREM|nr:hypothetical protein PHET_09131 [Paragonimus heterotremus]